MGENDDAAAAVQRMKGDGRENDQRMKDDEGENMIKG